MKFKLEPDENWYTIQRASGTLLFLGADGYEGIKVPIFQSSEKIILTDLPPLYKKDRVGRWQTLEFSIKLTSNLPMKRRTVSTPGLLTKEYNSPVKVVPSKYLTDSIQDQLQSAWNKKLNRDGWVISQDDVVLQEPMLLHHWDLYKDHMTYPAIIMPKYNGIRSTWKPHVGLMSRKRKPFVIPHLDKQCKILGMTVDGELWCPDTTLEEIVSLVAHDPTGKLRYVLFNRPNGGTFIARMRVLIEHLQTVSSDTPNLSVVPMAVVHSRLEAESAFMVIKEYGGVDGAVICTLDYEYQFDVRSRDILKMKDLISDEFTVIAVGYDDDPLGKMIRFTFDCPVGSFDYIPAWTKKRRVDEYHESASGRTKFVGKQYTLTFREYTAKGLPKHITSILERSYE